MFLICSCTLFSEKKNGVSFMLASRYSVSIERKYCLPFYGFLLWISIRLGAQLESLLIVFWP